MRGSSTAVCARFLPDSHADSDPQGINSSKPARILLLSLAQIPVSDLKPTAGFAQLKSVQTIQSDFKVFGQAKKQQQKFRLCFDTYEERLGPY